MSSTGATNSQAPATEEAGAAGHDLFALPASFAQQRLWFLDQLEPGTALYNIPTAKRMVGPLNVKALEQTLNEIVRRHEIFRTTFDLIDGELKQLVAPTLLLRMPLIDLSKLSREEQQAETQRLMEQESQRPFDLTRGPLLRQSLLRLETEQHVFLLTMHHIVSDGWSREIFQRELSTLYDAYSKGEPSPLPELPIQYGDYAAWQREWLQGEVLEQQLEYWKKHLGPSIPVLELPTDHPRPPVQSLRGARLSIELPVQLTDALKQLSCAEGVTLFITLLTAFQVLLHRYTGQSDIIVGTPMANRQRAEVQGLIGFFVNSLVLRTDLSGDPHFRELLKRTEEVVLEAYEHQDLPFEKLVEALQPERTMSHSPLFQVLFMLRYAMEATPPNLSGLSLQPLEVETGTTKADLSLELVETDLKLKAIISYRTDLFEEQTIARMLRHYRELLLSLSASPHLRLSQLSILSASESHQLIYDFNPAVTATAISAYNIISLFEAQAAATPTALAVVCAGQQVSYAELNERANQVAWRLRREGVLAEERVGVMMERSVEMVEALLGIMKAGAAYVALDTEYPAERLSFILRDAGISVVLTQQKFSSLPLVGPGTRVLCVDTDRTEPKENMGLEIAPGNLAYVAYTSGSTGRPKGVSIPHQAVVRLVTETNYASFWPSEVFLQLAPLSFDASTFEIWGALLNGARLIVMPPGAISLEELGKAIKDYHVTTLWLTAGLFHQIVDFRLEDLKSLRQLLAGGDVLSVSHVQRFLREVESCTLINGYGPTENTTFTCCYSVSNPLFEEASVPIGYPISSTQVFIVDRNLQLVPLGVAGELCAAGRGLARGYLNNPQATAEKFIPNPFSEEPGSRLYRTGDLARHREDGRIEFLGRLDEQVKIRGFRIEPGEIEATLSQYPGLRDCLVMAREDVRGDKRLVAYLAADPEHEIRSNEVNDFLKQRLPDYMLPTSFVMLAEMPLTPNGKIDRRALPAPVYKSSQLNQASAVECTVIEEIMTGIWSRILHVEQVGLHDNFFELGGHSLLATQLISRVREALQVVVPLRALFEAPTIADFVKSVEAARSIASHASQSIPLILPSADEKPAPLSFQQEWLWSFEQTNPGTASYNMAYLARLHGRLEVEALKAALTEIVRRHQSLRTSFALLDGQPVQLISEVASLGLPLIDLRHLREDEREAEARLLWQAEFNRPFDLSRDLMLRAGCVRIKELDHILYLTIHHIASDGWSRALLFRELNYLYNANSKGEPSSLPELQIQYADYARWQRGWLQGEVWQHYLSYWKQQLKDTPALLNLRTDKLRPPLQRFRGKKQTLRLSLALTDELKDFSQRAAVSLYILLLVAFDVLLYRYSGETDIVVGADIANRNHAEVEDLIGFFLNAVALRADLSGDPSFEELLRRVAKTTLEAYEYQDMPFERLIDELRVERAPGYHPLFQVMFNIQNMPDDELNLAGLEARAIRSKEDDFLAKFDLELVMRDTPEGLVAGLFYDSDLFDDKTIDQMLRFFETLLNRIIANSEERLSALVGTS